MQKVHEGSKIKRIIRGHFTVQFYQRHHARVLKGIIHISSSQLESNREQNRT